MHKPEQRKTLAAQLLWPRAITEVLLFPRLPGDSLKKASFLFFKNSNNVNDNFLAGSLLYHFHPISFHPKSNHVFYVAAADKITERNVFLYPGNTKQAHIVDKQQTWCLD